MSALFYEAPVLPEHARLKVRDAASVVEQVVQRRHRVSVKHLLLPLLTQVLYSRCLIADALGSFEAGGERHFLPRFFFQRTQVKKKRFKIGIFAGIHGDEPGGVLGLMDFVRELDEDPELGRHFELSLYPLCNPTGYLAGTRESATGSDLNREFWRGSNEPEVALLEKEIAARNFDGIISLHSDDTSPGFYGYARGTVFATQLLAPALAAAERAQPLDSRPFIDGFHAVNGIIHDSFDGILSAPPNVRQQPFEIILESPANTPLADQRTAFTLALKSVLSEYRKFIAYGGDL
jgi:murein peptide amidase A